MREGVPTGICVLWTDTFALVLLDDGVPACERARIFFCLVSCGAIAGRRARGLLVVLIDGGCCSLDEGDRVVIATTDFAKVTLFEGRAGSDCRFDGPGNDDGGGDGGRLRFCAEAERATGDTLSSSSSSASASLFSSLSSSSEMDPDLPSPSDSALSVDSASSVASSSSFQDPIPSHPSSSASALNHGTSSPRVRSSTRSEDSRTRSRVRRSSLRGGSLSRRDTSPAYIVDSGGDNASAEVPGTETAGGTAYRESLPVDQSRKTMRAAAPRSGLAP